MNTLKDNLSSTFGKAEMEWAAERILYEARIKGDWQFAIDVSDFKHDDHSLRGFVLLLAYGWIEVVNDKSFTQGSEVATDEIVVTKDFVERVTNV